MRGLKEFGEPARKALIILQAAPDLRARTYGAYYLIRDTIVTAGSLIGAWLWSISPQTNFVARRCLGWVVRFGIGGLWFAGRKELVFRIKSYQLVSRSPYEEWIRCLSPLAIGSR